MTSSQTAEQVASQALQEYRLYGSRHVKHYRVYGEPEKYSQKYERDPYSQVQNFLYKRAMIGLSIYNQQEIKEMHWEKRKRIRKVHKRAQRILNTWKQEVMIQATNLFFMNLFPNNNITKELVEGSEPDPAFKNTLDFKDLGITKDMIVEKLVGEGVLPPDFHSLK